MWTNDGGMITDGRIKVDGGENAEQAVDALNFETDPFVTLFNLGVPYMSMLAIFNVGQGKYCGMLQRAGLICGPGKEWSASDVAFIKKNYKSQTIAMLSRELKRNPKTVTRKLTELGLRK